MILSDVAAAVLLSPLLLYQARSVQKRALQLPEALGPRKGRIGRGPPLRLLIVGDSSAAGVGVTDQADAVAGQISKALSDDFCLEWQLIASTGATTPSTLERLQHETLPPADIALIILGVNDVTRGGPMKGWLRNHANLRDMLRARCGVRHLYVSQIPPLGAFPLLPNPLRWLLGRRAIRFDAALAAALKAHADCTYLSFPTTLDPSDMAIDGFHPGPVIYANWSKEMARQICIGGPF